MFKTKALIRFGSHFRGSVIVLRSRCILHQQLNFGILLSLLIFTARVRHVTIAWLLVTTIERSAPTIFPQPLKHFCLDGFTAMWSDTHSFEQTIFGILELVLSHEAVTQIGTQLANENYQNHIKINSYLMYIFYFLYYLYEVIFLE